MSNRHFGPQATDDGVTLRLWAPAAKSVDAIVDGARQTMVRADGGWFMADVQGTYVVTLSGERASGVPEPLEDFSFTVRFR